MSQAVKVTRSVRELLDRLVGNVDVMAMRQTKISRHKAKQRRNGKKFLNRYVLGAEDGIFNLKEIMKYNNDNIFLGVSDIEDLRSEEHTSELQSH